MLISQQELPPEYDVCSIEPEGKPVSIPVRWRTVSFECSIKILAGCAGDAQNRRGPVRLRVSEAAADSCRLEIFCGEAGLCGVTAGY
jgi:hypothetical protein